MDIIPNHDGYILHAAIKPDYVDEDIGFQDLPIIGFRWASPDSVIPITIFGEPKSGWEWVILFQDGTCRHLQDGLVEVYETVEHFDRIIQRLVEREKDEWRTKGLKGREEL